MKSQKNSVTPSRQILFLLKDTKLGSDFSVTELFKQEKSVITPIFPIARNLVLSIFRESGISKKNAMPYHHNAMLSRCDAKHPRPKIPSHRNALIFRKKAPLCDGVTKFFHNSILIKNTL